METVFYTAEEVAEMLGISKSHSYKLIRELNEELKAKGYTTIRGKVSRLFFEEKIYGLKTA